MKTKTPLHRIAALFALALLATFGATHEAKAQYQVTTLGTAVVETFTSYAGTSAPTNWTIVNANNGVNISNTFYRGLDNGATNASNSIRSYGAVNDSDRALGFLGSGSLLNFNASATFVNNTGSTVTSFVLSYVAEQWRSGGGSSPVSSTFTVQYSINGGSFSTLNDLAWTAPQNTPTGALNGYSDAFSDTLTQDVTGISLLNGQNIVFRWQYLRNAGTGEGLGIDDVSVTFNGGPASGNYWAPGASGGGDGNWGPGNNNWATGPGQQGNGGQAASGALIFAGAQGNVTVAGGGVTVDAGMQFSTSGYAISGGAIDMAGANIGANTITTDANVGATISSIVSGSAGLTKAGTGTLTLGGANTYTGGTVISGGRLVGSTTSLQGNITNNAALTFNQTTNGTFSSAVSGTGSLVKDGSGSVTLSGANTYSGGTLVSAGTLIGTTTSLQGTITNNAAVTFNQSANGTYANAMSGTGGMTKSGAGTLTMSGVNTFSGATTINAGELVVNGTNASSAVTVSSSTTLSGSGQVGGLTVSGLLSPGNSIGTLSAGNTTFNGGGSFELEIFDWVNVAGTGWDLFAITGDLTLNNTSGSPFTINLVSLANSTTPGLSTDWDQNVNFTNTFVTVSGSLLGTPFASNLFTVNTNGFQNTVNGTFSITNVGNNLALLYTTSFVPATEYIWNTGAGAWGTGGSWSGGVAPSNNSAIIFSGAGGASTNNLVNTVQSLLFSNSAGSYTVSGDALTVGALGVDNESTAAQTINNNLTLGAAQTFLAANGDLTFGGTIDNSGNLLTIAGNSNTAINGAISGNGGLTKSGNGSLTLGGNNSYTGALSANGGTTLVNGTQAATTINVGGGTLLLGASDVLANGATVALTTGTVNFGGFSDTITTFNQSGGVFTNGTLTATTYGLSGGTVGGTLGAGTANVTGGVTLSGVIDSTLNINTGGTLTLAAADRIGNSSALTVDAGTLATATFNDTVGSVVLTNNGSITGTGTITAETYTLNGGTVGANLGTGTATSSAGTTTLNGTLEGDLTVSGGTLTLGGADRLANSSAVTVSAGTLNFGGFTDAVGSFSLSGGVFTNGTVTTTTYALSGGTVGGTLGAGTANVTGGVTLSGVIDSTLNINTGGTLTLAAADRINNSSAVTVDAGTLATATFNDTVGSLLLTNNGSITGTGTITAGTYILNGGTVSANLGAGTANVSAGTTTLNGAFAVTTLNIDGGTLALGGNGRIDNAAVVNLSSGVLDMVTFADGVGTFNMTGGTVNGSGANLLSAVNGLNLQAGTINANIGNSAVGISNGTTTINGTVGGAVTVSSGTADLNGALASSLTASGGTVNLSNTVAGNVTVSGGTVNLGSADRIGASSAVNVSSGSLNLNGNDSVGAVALTGGTIGGSGVLTGTSYAVQDGTISAALAGAGAMTKTGAGTTTLSANNSGFSGAVAVNQGAILASTSGALGSGTVTVTNGSTLAASGVTLANNFTIGTAGGTITNFGSTTVLAGWDFNGVTSYGTNDFQANTLAAGVNNPTGLTRGPGVGTGGTAAARGWGGTTWNSATQAAAITAGQYVTFTLTADPSTVLRLDSVDPFEYRRSGSGATLGALQYSTDGVSFTDITTSISYTSSANSGSTIAAIDLSTIADLESGTTLTFRLVNWGASGTGTWYLYDVGTDSGTDDFAITGQVGTVSSGPATGSGTLGIEEAGTATFSGNVVNNTEATFTAASGGLATFSGIVSGEGTLSKTGAGTVTLSGASANTFTGLTTVSAGTLQLDKTAGTDALAGDVTVNSGAVLLISASNQVNDSSAVSLSGGTITRGSGVSEVFGNLNLTDASFLDFGTGTAGTLSFGEYAPSALLTINNFLPGNTLTFGSDLSGSINNAALFSFDNGFNSSWNSGTSTFTITAIPEPSTYLAAAGLLSLMLWPSRKRIVRDAKKILGLTAPMRDRLAAKRA